MALSSQRMFSGVTRLPKLMTAKPAVISNPPTFRGVLALLTFFVFQDCSTIARCPAGRSGILDTIRIRQRWRLAINLRIRIEHRHILKKTSLECLQNWTGSSSLQEVSTKVPFQSSSRVHTHRLKKCTSCEQKISLTTVPLRKKSV